MDIEALEKALGVPQQVRLYGQTFHLEVPPLRRGMELQRALGKAVTAAAGDEDKRVQAFMDASVDAVEACLTDPVPRPLLEKIIVRSGVLMSPLVREARVLCGMDAPGAEEDPDPDLPT